VDAAYRKQFSVSLLGPNAYETYERQHFIDLLIDWKWFDKADPSVWYDAEMKKIETDQSANDASRRCC
jgi:hypothetical protein